jgi:hypothetical protein
MATTSGLCPGDQVFAASLGAVLQGLANSIALYVIKR